MAGRAGRAVYRTRAWALARAEVLARAGRRCEACGRLGRLEVHHRQALENGGAPYAPDNLQALCRDCHQRAHGRREPDEWDRELARLRRP